MSDLILTDEQNEAADLCVWLSKNRKQFGIVTGPAGTGKTTLTLAVQQRLKDVMFVAPTGKAAARLTEKSGARATTLHRWLKTAKELFDGSVVFEDKEIEEIEVPASGLIVIDEASMVGSDMWSDVFNACSALGLSVVLVGDEAQLPPVTRGDEVPFSVFSRTFQKQFKPAFYHRLTKIHRQALESPIIRAATAVRAGDYDVMLKELAILSPKDALESMREFDMVISHSNKTRHGLNALARHSQGRKGGLMRGEPLLVLKNNYQLDVFNGETYTANDVEELIICDVWDHYNKKEYKDIKFWTAKVGTKLAVISAAALDGIDEIPPTALKRSVSYFQKQYGPYLHCNYGYTLSAHKAQGSEADSVLVCLEPTVRMNEMEGRRWVYTAITRAKETCKVTFFDWTITKAIQERQLEL